MERQALLNDLRTAVVKDHLVVVAGTGVSLAACRNQEVDGHVVASWPGLLTHGASFCRQLDLIKSDEAAMLDAQISSGHTEFLVSAAEFITKRLTSRSAGTFQDWLKRTLGALDVSDPALPEAIGQLPGLLVTLCYDHLLDNATKRQPLTWLNADRIQDALRGDTSQVVLHLHGEYLAPRSVVLGSTSYFAVASDPHTEAVLRTLAMDRSLLFIGCGATLLDPNFARLVEWGRAALASVSPKHYYLCRTQDLPALTIQLGDVPWLWLLDYGAAYDDLVPFLRSLQPVRRPSVDEASAAFAADLDLVAYRSAMKKRYGRLKLEELDPTTHDMKPVLLEQMFVGQSVKNCGGFQPRVLEIPRDQQLQLMAAGEIAEVVPDAAAAAAEGERYRSEPATSALGLFSRGRGRIVILGDPGSGKSTLFQHQLLVWAEVPTPETTALPLIIELRDYARLRRAANVNDFLEYLHSGASVRWHLNQDALEDWLLTYDTRVYFDGLDEVFDPDLRREVTTAICRFADRYPRAGVFVSSRVVGFNHRLWEHEGFERHMLQDLEHSQIQDFVGRWHAAAYEVAAEGSRREQALLLAINTSRAVRRLAGNPLLLTMMAILNRSQELPRDRAELYEQCARLLLHQWKTEWTVSELGAHTGEFRLDFKDKRHLMMLVARVMQAGAGGLAGNLIVEAVLESTLADGLRALQCGRADFIARRLIEQLSGRNFMLASVGGRCYAFVHRTFLEYFCALDICERFQVDQTLSVDDLRASVFAHWSDQAWHEPLHLVAGMLAPRFVASLLDWLCEQEADGSHPGLLAATCVGQVRVRNGLGETDARVLATAQEGYQWCLTHTGSYHEAARIVEVVSAVWPRHPQSEQWLMGVAEDGGPGADYAFDLVVRKWKSPLASLSWLRFAATTSPDPGLRADSVKAIAESWSQDADTLPFLKHLGRDDVDGDVRNITVGLVASVWSAEPTVANWLRARVCRDPRRAVRTTALAALGRFWKHDQSVLHWVRKLAEEDEDERLRQAALEAIGQYWPEHPDTLPWLESRAHEDPHEAVRGAAAAAKRTRLV